MARFQGALSRIRSAFPDADVHTLKLIRDYFKDEYRIPRDYQSELPLSTGALDKIFREQANTMLAVTPPRTTLAEDPIEELSRLYQVFVAPSSLTPRPISRVQLAPSALRQRLTRWMERKELVGLHKYQAAFEIQGSVSRWTFDYGTRNGVIRALQTVSMVGPFDLAMSRAALLSAEVKDLRDVQRSKDAVQVVAIVDNEEPAEPLNFLRAHDVDVVPLSDGPQLAARLHLAQTSYA
jgi:hypothetical protein